ncbi:MAG: LPS assembly lipoprotein LptE [Candidatus Omnitrophica bacterium]|nr:LPS assembly lipoprotein LptE [Candidatus Omnitrophota bacterium]
MRHRISLKRLLIIFAICYLPFAILGCGYTTRSAISTKYKTVYIPPFLNKIDIANESSTGNKYTIYHPGLESDVTKGVSNKFLFDGNIRPVKSEAADVTLKGELVDYRRDALRYDDSSEVAEYRISVSVNLKLWDNRKNELIWEENGFTGIADYFPTTSTLLNVTKKTDDQAISDAVVDLARRIVERSVEEW